MSYFSIHYKEPTVPTWIYIYLWVSSASDTSAGGRVLRIWYGDTKIFDKAPASNRGSDYIVDVNEYYYLSVAFSAASTSGSTEIDVIGWRKGNPTGVAFLDSTVVTSKIMSGYIFTI